MRVQYDDLGVPLQPSWYTVVRTVLLDRILRCESFRGPTIDLQ